MEATDVLWIQNPSKDLVAFIDNAQQVKTERLEAMRRQFTSQQNGL